MKINNAPDPKMVRSAGSADPMEPRSQEFQQWAYKTVIGPRGMDLSEFGAQGWELVSAVPQPADQVAFYFRRRK